MAVNAIICALLQASGVALSSMTSELNRLNTGKEEMLRLEQQKVSDS
jgi:hypothetical protein